MEEQTKVLVVDDEEVMRDLISDVLSEVGYKVETVAGGDQAIEKIQHDKFSIVVTDLKMPGIDGLEVLKRIKAIDSDACLIVITAYPSIESVVTAMRAGAYDYIVKPFNIEEMKLVIRRAAERQYLLCEASKKEFYKELSILDGLTGIYNHRHFYEVLSREIERAKRYQHALCLLMIDLDDFKGYNDAHGHLAGDRLLQSFAEFFVKAVRSSDMVFRYGGDEFTIIYPETDIKGSMEITRRLLNLSKQEMPLTMSIGISCLDISISSMDELVRNADEALYQAKRSGKNSACIGGRGSEPLNNPS